jgi:hypothetical protein
LSLAPARVCEKAGAAMPTSMAAENQTNFMSV